MTRLSSAMFWIAAVRLLTAFAESAAAAMMASTDDDSPTYPKPSLRDEDGGRKRRRHVTSPTRRHCSRRICVPFRVHHTHDIWISIWTVMRLLSINPCIWLSTSLSAYTRSRFPPRQRRTIPEGAHDCNTGYHWMYWRPVL